jgi:3-oxoacyl-[acyl-carrier protein] reductase
VELRDKVIWVTGASRGIGRETAVRCAREGAAVVLSARSELALNETAESIRSAHGQEPLVLPMDVADPASIKAAFQRLHGSVKRLDGLVNNAGILRDAVIGMIGAAQMEEVMRTNAYGPIHLLQYAARFMTREKSGAIVNVASIVGRTGNEGQVVYAASKAALIGATKAAARELARLNVRVNAVAPGVIETDMISRIPPAKLDALKADIKMGRLGTAADVADVIVFLLSDRSRYVTGQLIGVDGGMWL